MFRGKRSSAFKALEYWSAAKEIAVSVCVVARGSEPHRPKMAIPGSAADVRDLFQKVMRHGCAHSIPDRLAEGVGLWLRSDRAIESIPEAAPTPREIGPILFRICGCEALAEFHEHVYSIMAAQTPGK